MSPEEYLSQIGTLTRRVALHTERLRRLCREADAVSSSWGEHLPSGRADPPWLRLLERIESLREELERENDLLARLQAQAEETIERLPEEMMRLVMLYRYLEGDTFSRIGDLLFMSKANAKRWHDRALERLVLPEDPVSVLPERAS